MRRLAALAALVAVAACAPSAADHEELGDRLYAAGSYPDALAEYELGVRANPKSADLAAKTAAAALHVGDLELAAAQYRALGADDRSRAAEAAEGLDRVARAALRGGDHAALADAVAGLEALGAGRPLGAYAGIVATDAMAQGRPADAVALLPAAVAAAADSRTADSLLYAYGMAAAALHQCDTAVAAFDAVIRRNRDPDVVGDAQTGLAGCALIAGQAALAAGRAGDAEGFFRSAAEAGAGTDVGRAAWIGLGDVQLARGDLAGAAESYRRATQGGAPGDSLSTLARQKLGAMGNAGAMDTTTPRNP